MAVDVAGVDNYDDTYRSISLPATSSADVVST